MNRRAAALFGGWACVASLGCGSRTGFELSAAGLGVDGGTTTQSCTGEGVVVLAPGANAPAGVPLAGNAIAVDSTSVYWTTVNPRGGAGGSVMKVPRCGGASTTLASITYAGDIINALALAVDSTNVYWGTHDEAQGAPGDQVMATPIGGGVSIPIAAGDALTLVADATSVYWTDTQQGVFKVPLAGGTPFQLASSRGQGVGVLAVDGTHAYWAQAILGIRSAPLDGGEPTTLVPGTMVSGSGVARMLVAGDRLYWVEVGPAGGILSVPTGGGAPVVLVAETDIASLALDDTNLYWLNDGCPGSACTGLVKKVPLGGGTPTVVVPGSQAHPGATGALVVDATSVYWTSGNAVMKWSPK
jgi:hypothetical protein